MEIKVKKSLGQNFLTDKNIIKSIVDIGFITDNDVILEVGPGTGNLTEFIFKKNPKQIYAIEKDYNLVNFLNEKFEEKIKIINEDILNFKINNISNEKFIIYGNLPYNISTQILTQWIVDQQQFGSIKKLILMFQKEVANRIIAKINSKNYGRLSIISNWKLNIKKEFDINPKSFFPKPKVDSTLLSFVPRKDFFHIKKPANLEKITRIFFNQRRKMIKNPLRQIFKDPDQIAEKLKLNINLRPQNLSPKNYFDITTEYEKLNIVPLEVRIRNIIGKVIAPSECSGIDREIQDIMNNGEVNKAILQYERNDNIFNWGRSGEVGADYIINYCLENNSSRKLNN